MPSRGRGCFAGKPRLHTSDPGRWGQISVSKRTFTKLERRVNLHVRVIATQARDLELLRDYMHIDAAHIIGSPASRTAMCFAASAPYRVAHSSLQIHALTRMIPAAHFHIIKDGPHGLLMRSAEARRVVIAWLQEREAPAKS